jgi:hypothetical protein
MHTIDLASGRDTSGRFVPGMSGNPAGKRPGTRNRRTVLKEALRDGEDSGVARVVIDQALAGDVVTARFLLGLLCPKPRGREIALDLPEDARPGDVLAAFDATIAALAAGEITPDEALTVSRVLESRSRVAQATDSRHQDVSDDHAVAAAPTATDAVDPAETVAVDTPIECVDTAKPLHSACKLPDHATMTSAAALLSRETRPQRPPLVTRGAPSVGRAAA